ncbi:MAG TPA: transketolase [Gammaproteobacteria bacterium]|nr:transketolase [Gammaproteobacteria bacterium]
MALRTDNPTAGARPSRRRLANAIRMLSMDAVEAAKSGHPGMPMGMADIAEVLWNDYLRFNPANGHWHGRDRFVLSNGHGSMLLYSVAYLTGYPIGLDEIKKFRQLGSRAAGHPERDLDIGIETTTGPLGQGLANAVGMALTEKHLAAEFNRPGHDVVDHYTYVFMGDGCLMEGISHEACSFAGTHKLGKLIGFYDDNGISIDGETRGWFTDDTPKRFAAYGWHVVPNVDGHDADAVRRAIDAARAERERPSLICCKTIIGYGAPHVQGTSATHGAALGAAEAAAARKNLGWDEPPFVIPADVKAAWDARERGARLEAEWSTRFAAYRKQHPELADELERRMSGKLPAKWSEHAEKAIETLAASGKPMATRKSSQAALEAFAPALPELVGGSADLTGSNNTQHKFSKPLTPSDASGNYLFYGVREFGMAAMMNGQAAHGGVIPYGGTFLVFSDYARNALRMSALIGLRSIFVLTHDSIGLGEDGPTHQPIEHLASLRLMPNMDLWRPCDTVETAVAWRAAIERGNGPTCLALTRQDLPHVTRTEEQIAMIARGAYIVSNGNEAPAITLIATGSEVQLAIGAARELEKAGVSARVVSMPCTQAFDRQPAEYRDHVLPPNGARLVVEAGATGGWWRYVGARGAVVGLDRFGHSAPAKALFEHFGFTVEAVVAAAKRLL